MGELIFISAVFVLIAQAMGLRAYYRKQNQYSKSTQYLATLLPAGVFALLAFLGALLILFLAQGGKPEWAQQIVLSLPPPLENWVIAYIFVGAFANIFLSILVQLVILLVHPPKIRHRRYKRRSTP